MHLHLAALLALVVEEAPLGRLEGIADRDAEIRISEFFARMMRFAADDEFLAGHAHIDVDVVQIAGVMPAVQLLDRHPAPGQMLVEPIELVDPLPDLGLDLRRGRHVVKDDLDWNIHRPSPVQ